jgi:hypothetical protein
VKEDENAIFVNKKYVRCVYHMAFAESIDDSLLGANKDKTLKPGVENGDRNMCLVMYQQYVNEHHIRLNYSQKDKFLLYVIEDKTFAKKEFEQVDWAQVCFP